MGRNHLAHQEGTMNHNDYDWYYDRANGLCIEDRWGQAIIYALEGLRFYADRPELLILIGDIYVLRYEELGMSEEEACGLALDYFERAIQIEPGLADAWAGKSLALKYLRRHGEALQAAEEGLKVLPRRQGIYADELYTNIAESLFAAKVTALAGLGRAEEAREALSEGLGHCPGSSYLSLLVDEVAPQPGDSQHDSTSDE